MHRVELKGIKLAGKGLLKIFVPNAPCGVESLWDFMCLLLREWFLMHRVELKVMLIFTCKVLMFLFLMHRVELKDSFGR